VVNYWAFFAFARLNYFAVLDAIFGINQTKLFNPVKWIFIWFYRFLRGLSSLFFDLIGFDQTLVLTSIDFSADWGRFFVGC